MLMDNQRIVWRFNTAVWVLGAIALALSIWGYSSSLANLISRWDAEEEYSHGYLIPLVSLFFIWEQRARFQENKFQPSWWGPVVLLIALLLFVMGELTALYSLGQISFIVGLFGFSLALLGRQGAKLTFVPIGLLVFAIPIPGFLEATLTAKLQLISSTLGVGFIRLFNIPVFREGNLIDLGSYKLEVVEACSGLTYLYPLLWFGCIFAYMYRTTAWKRVLVIFSTIPVAVLLNSIRIGAIGVLVNKFGNSMAEGFLHAFEGWAVFMVCVAILLGVVWLLTFVGADRRPFKEVFGLHPPSAGRKDGARQVRPMSKPFLAAVLVSVTTAALSGFVSERPEIKPVRASFSAFPMDIGQWHGKTSLMGEDSLKVLRLSDYILAVYNRGTEAPINFYAAYYASQRKGSAPHSPAVCMPGGGWQMTDLTQRSLPSTAIPGGDFSYNRAVIRNGEATELVYYWYQERGKRIASEYSAKGYLFSDALLMNRSDGALVRLVTPIVAGETEEAADQRLMEFVAAVVPVLPQYIPN